MDKTYGHASYSCVICCGPNNPWMVYSPLTLTVNGYANQAVQALNSCTQHIVTVTGDFPTWWTGNSSIATASNTQINGVAVGTTDHDAQSINMYWGPRADSGGGDCPLSQEVPTAPTDVNPTVTIDSFSPNPIVRGSTASVHITVNPSANIALMIIKNGTGTATFGTSGNTTLQITQTTTVNILGGAESNGSPDLTLTASFGGSLLTSAPFSVTTGACTATNTGHGGPIVAGCPSSQIQNYDTYNIAEYCIACSFSCLPINYDYAFTPSSCTPVVSGIAGAGNRGLTSTETITYAATNCVPHSYQIKTIITNAQGVITNYIGGTFGIKCDSNGSPKCP